MGRGRRGGRAFVNLVLVKAAGRPRDAVLAARQEARFRSWERARVEGGDEAPARGRCSERRSRRGLYVSRTQDARPRRGLDDARCLREPSEARGVDLVVLRDEGRNTSADVWREPVDAQARDAVDHERRSVRGSSMDSGATLDDLREAVTTLEEIERIMRRVLGGAHPDTTAIEAALRNARATLRALENNT